MSEALHHPPFPVMMWQLGREITEIFVDLFIESKENLSSFSMSYHHQIILHVCNNLLKLFSSKYAGNS
jgi:hypothetical protein